MRVKKTQTAKVAEKDPHPCILPSLSLLALFEGHFPHLQNGTQDCFQVRVRKWVGEKELSRWPSVSRQMSRTTLGKQRQSDINGEWAVSPGQFKPPWL